MSAPATPRVKARRLSLLQRERDKRREGGKGSRTPQPPPRGKVLKPSEAAAFLGVSVRTLEGWRARGGGPLFLRVGPKLIRYCERDLNAFQDACERANTSETERQAAERRGAV